jgi:uncharacterized OsmC-like protein
MGEARVKWIEKRQFVGIDSSKHSVVMSSQDGDSGAGMRPSDLLLVALGGLHGLRRGEHPGEKAPEADRAGGRRHR